MLKIDPGLPDDQGAIPARLTLKKDAPYGPLAGEVRLEFTGPADYTLAVPFTAYVTEDRALSERAAGWIRRISTLGAGALRRR